MSHNKLSAALIALPLALALTVGGTVIAAETKAGEVKGDAKQGGTNRDPDRRGSSPQADAVAQAALAEQLIEYGDRNKDALALITGAQIKARLGVRDGPAEKKETKGGDAKAGKPTSQRDTSVAAVVTRAKQYAGDRKDLIALADDIGKSRGAQGGPRNGATDVNPRARDIFNVSFRGGEPAIVAISGDGDTDLDLHVYDQNGNLICRAEGPTDDETCRWTPRWTGSFRIEVRNLGTVYNRYRIMHN